MTKTSEFQYFQTVHGEWSDETFGLNRKPTAPLHHLKKEVEEIISEPYDVEEYADGFCLLIDSARLAGFDMNAILDAMWMKFEKNKNRTWSKPDENGVCEHVRTENETQEKGCRTCEFIDCDGTEPCSTCGDGDYVNWKPA